MSNMRNIFILVVALFPFFGITCAEKSSNENASLMQLIDDHTEFTFSLYPMLNSPDTNLVFSPYSLSTCLSMVYLGARDVTAEEMSTALKLNFSPKEIAAPSALLNQSLLPERNNYELTLANALWLDDKTYILSDYRYAIEKQFNAKIGNLSFSQPDIALSTINHWVADKTQNHIQNLLTQNDISANTRLILTNAAYFKGAFTQPFDDKLTKEGSFFPSSAQSQQVQMMEQTSRFSYTENDLFQAVALPFKGTSKGKGQLALLILLPRSAENFDSVLTMMPKAYAETLSALENAKVHIKLPKFVLTKRYELNTPLQRLGMKNPFTTQANFSGIDGMLNLYLNTIVHETYFSLDENGVIAAAATAASMNMTAVPNLKPPVEFIADHPFLFFIVDLKSKEMLFIGKYADPTDAI